MTLGYVHGAVTSAIQANEHTCFLWVCILYYIWYVRLFDETRNASSYFCYLPRTINMMLYIMIETFTFGLGVCEVRSNLPPLLKVELCWRRVTIEMLEYFGKQFT